MKLTPITSFPAYYAERVARRIERYSAPGGDGCIEWIGCLDKYGYGQIKTSIGGVARSTGAHRAAWLALRGDIQDGLVIDHLCRNRACVNVDHMEPVTGAINTRRGELKGKTGRKKDGIQTGCGKHGFEDGYYYSRKDGYTAWTCRPCRSRRFQEYLARQRPHKSVS